MIKDVKNIMYEKNMGFSLPEYFQIEVKEEKNYLKYIGNRYNASSQNPKIIEISDDILLDFMYKLFSLTCDWKNEYVDERYTLDGTNWQLKLIYSNDYIKNYIGKNSFPYNFSSFEKIIYDILNKVFGDK